jgi:CheY-like chemotaxis protein
MALKILTVDDSKTIRMIMKKAFIPFYCEFFEGENGVEGLAIANREKPDLIFLDITMPIMDGIEMLDKLKGEPTLKDIPVIMLTAESGQKNVMQILKMGVKDYIVKPFKGEELIERAQKIIPLKPNKRISEGETSKIFFKRDEDAQVLVLPSKITKPVAVEVARKLRYMIEEMEKLGLKKLILDQTYVSETNVTLIRLILSTINISKRSNLRLRLVGNAKLIEGLKEFQETCDIPIEQSVEEAKAAFYLP